MPSQHRDVRVTPVRALATAYPYASYYSCVCAEVPGRVPSLYRLSVCNRARAERRHANGGNYVAIPLKASLSHYCRCVYVGRTLFSSIAS